MDYKDLQAGTTNDHFWFKGKTELIRVLLGKSIGPKRDLQILTVGAGTGEDLFILKEFGRICAIDIDENALKLIPTDLVAEKRYADACNLPYEENAFDLVVALDVIEHIQDDKKAVSEILRVLKPGGKFIMTVPAFNILFSAHDKALNHCRRYNRKSLNDILFDFANKKCGYWFFFLFLPAAFFRLLTKNKKSEPSTKNKFPGVLNFAFYLILKLECLFIRMGMVFPFGLTLYAVAQKK